MAAAAGFSTRFRVAAASIQKVVDHGELLAERLASGLGLAQVLPHVLAPIR